MTDNIKLLLKYEAKKKSHNMFMIIAFNLGLLIMFTIETLNVIPNISTSHEFTGYITFKIYQAFVITISTFAMVSVSSIADIKNYRHLLSYPIKYEELFAFIKIKKIKNFIITLVVNLIAVFYIGFKLNQGLTYYVVFLLGFLITATLCYFISDIICFILYFIFPYKAFAFSVVIALLIPGYTVINSMKLGNVINFYDVNKTYIDILDKIFPYCKFVRNILFNNPEPTYSGLAIMISFINILLIALVYQFLIKLLFFKVLEKEDNQKSTYSKININNIKPRSDFISSCAKEWKFVFRTNKGLIFPPVVIAIFSLLVIQGIINRVFSGPIGEEIIPTSALLFIKEDKMLITIFIVSASLIIDIINYKLNSGRISLGNKYLSFNKYIQLNHKNTIYSIILIRIIISYFYYAILFLLFYLFNICNNIVIWSFIICSINIVTVAAFDLIMDINIPNLYTKVELMNLIFDVTKGAGIIIFKLVHLGVLISILSLVKNIQSATLINNLIFLFIVMLIVNSKYTLKKYNYISYR
ncbi:MAG: hypothetical protein E7211_04165 [Clostridium lundense]|nr:hypothetical protein [Clostridium lundense]